LLYERIDVWRRTGSGALIQYRCFRLLPSGGFCIQSADFFEAASTATRHTQSESQFLELLAEQPPEQRSGVFPTLDEAVNAFDRDFGNQWKSGE
jgi:hypothetical protein